MFKNTSTRARSGYSLCNTSAAINKATDFLSTKTIDQGVANNRHRDKVYPGPNLSVSNPAKGDANLEVSFAAITVFH